MSTNYSKGRNFEYRVKNDLEEKGYYVVRSAGSKGVFDLVALKPHRRTLGIQCKYGDIDKKSFDSEFVVLHDFAKSLSVRTILACAKPRGEITYFDGFSRERTVIV